MFFDKSISLALILTTFTILSVDAQCKQFVRNEGISDGAPWAPIDTICALPNTIKAYNRAFSKEKVDMCMGEKVILFKNKFIVWVESGKCSPCYVDELHYYDSLARGIKDVCGSQYELVVLMSPNKKEIEPLKQKLKTTHLDFPVYIDVDNKFGELNPTTCLYPKKNSIKIIEEKIKHSDVCIFTDNNSVSRYLFFNYYDEVGHITSYILEGLAAFMANKMDSDN